MNFLRILSSTCICTLLCFASGNAAESFNEDDNAQDNQEKIYCTESTVDVTEEGIKVDLEETAKTEAQTVITAAIYSDDTGLFVLEDDIIAKCPCASKKKQEAQENN